MEQERPSPKRKSFWIALVVIALCVPMAVCCGVFVNSEYPAETRAPQEFPNTDIAFVTNGGLGFVNEDGSEFMELEFSAKMAGGRFSGYSGRALRPVLTGDNELAIVQVNPYEYFGMKGLYVLALWRVGEFPSICWNWDRQADIVLSEGQQHIFIQTDQGVAVYPLEGCVADHPHSKLFQGITGVPSPDMQFVAVTQVENNGDRILTIIDLNTEERRTIGPGDYPAWSRDGQWLAYTGVDGLYAVNLTAATEPQLVLSYVNPVGSRYPTYHDINDVVPPEPRWSPDGEWLTYHRQLGPETARSPDNYAIYKLDIATGEEFKIAGKGVYPHWRWPVEGP